MPKAATPRTYTLRRASSIVLALVSVLPLLLFVYTIAALDGLQHRVAQVGLGSALVLSMIGFYIYSIMMSRLADILLEIEWAAAGLPRRHTRLTAHDRPVSSACGGLVLPGIGRITEAAPPPVTGLSELGAMWRAEAEPLLTQRVLVAVRDAAAPIRGILAQVTPDGVIIDHEGSTTSISYTSLSLIEADTFPDPA